MWREDLIMNKILAAFLIFIGAWTILISGGDGTFFVIAVIVGIILFCSKTSIFKDWEDED